MNKQYWVLFREAYKHGDVAPHEQDIIFQLYKSEGRDKIVEVIKKKKLFAAIAKLFTDLEIDKEYWAPQVDYYRRRNLAVIDSLDEMYELLEKNGVYHLAVVENFGALLSSKQDICMFNSGDVDQYGDVSEKEALYAVLKESGYEISENRAGNILISSSIKHKTLIPKNFYFGINWDITTRVNLPVISTNGPITNWNDNNYYKKTHIHIPAIETLMYICMMHVAVHGFCKAPDIRLYYDIANVADNCVNWNLLIDWAQRDHNEVRLATAAILANKLLDVGIPDFVTEIGNKKQVESLLSVVYRESDNSLVDFPGIKQRFLIETYSDDYGARHGFCGVFFPKREWITEKYGSHIIGRIKHLKDLL